ncbi:ribonuclease 3-like protein 3 [Tanacetum coccineum]
MVGSSSQPHTEQRISHIHAFFIEDMYLPELSDSFQHTGSFQETAREDSPVEVAAPPSNSKSKPTRGHQKMTVQNEGAPRAQESGARNEDYFNRTLFDYEAEHGMQFTLRHCWKVLKVSPKWMESEVPKFLSHPQASKRYKTSGSSSDKEKGLKKKRSRSAGSSSSLNDEALAKLMVSELAMHNERAIGMKKEERLAFMEIKRREVECRE